MARIVTIDGPSGSGKGTISQLLADHLGWHFLDSGALYRVVGLAAQRQGLEPTDIQGLRTLTQGLPVRFQGGHVYLAGEDVSAAIRDETAGTWASRVAAVPQVREILLDWQRAHAREPGLVADGRDMGTVVFPEAQLKIFLTASPEERARRRYNQLKEKGLDVSLANLAAEIRERDERDRNRGVAPLKAAAAALEVESSALSIQEVFARVLREVLATFPELRAP